MTTNVIHVKEEGLIRRGSPAAPEDRRYFFPWVPAGLAWVRRIEKARGKEALVFGIKRGAFLEVQERNEEIEL